MQPSTIPREGKVLRIRTAGQLTFSYTSIRFININMGYDCLKAMRIKELMIRDVKKGSRSAMRDGQYVAIRRGVLNDKMRRTGFQFGIFLLEVQARP